MGLFRKKPKPDPFNPFAEGANNFSQNSPASTPPPTATPPNTVSVEPSEPVVPPSPTIDPSIQPEPIQPFVPEPISSTDVQVTVEPIDTTTNPPAEMTSELTVPSPDESSSEIASPMPPPQPQDATPQPAFTEPAAAEQSSISIETQVETNTSAPDHDPTEKPVESQTLEQPATDIPAPPTPEDIQPTTPQVDDLIANSNSSLEITSQPTNNFFRKNLVPLIIISVVVIALSILSLVFYIKWQGEKADNLEKTGTINSLYGQIQSLQNDTTNDANLTSELDKLREEVDNLAGDKLKLEENNKTLTDQNTTLQQQNDDLNKQLKTAACEAMTNATEKQTCLDSIDTPATPTE